jgi:hypothetical protein
MAPTPIRAASFSHAGWNWETTPSTGASAYRPPSRVSPPTTGSVISAAVDTHRNSTRAVTEVSPTTRRRPRRPTRTSPASPEAASTPISATPATTVANSSLSHSGAAPRSIESVMAEGSQFWASAMPDTPSSSRMLSRERRSTMPSRSAPRPRTFCAAT